MIVWTHHKSTFPILSPELVIDPTSGIHYRSVQGYPSSLARLQELLGTNQFLWCVTSRDNWFTRMDESHDLIRWELDVPDSHVLALYREDVWEDLIYGRPNNWGKLIVNELGNKVGALVRVPINPAWATRQEINPEWPRLN